MSGKRWLVVLALAVLAAAASLLLVVLPKYVAARVLSSAEEQGVTLAPKDIAFGWGWLRLSQVKVDLDKVRSVALQVDRIDVTLDGLVPQSIELSNVDGLITGSLSNVGLELSEWTKAHPTAYALPLSAKNVHARFVEPAGTPPWLEVSEGQLSRTATGGVFAAEHTRFLGANLGKVGAGFAREASAIALGFGEADLGRAPFRVQISPALSTPTAKFSLAPIAADRLATLLGVKLPVSGVLVSSETTLAFPAGPPAGSVTGSTNIILKGYVPPHPFELDGLIFGDTTTFASQFAMPPIRDRITLTESRLEAGSFELRGDGLLTRASDHSQATLTLSGLLPCSALASVEAESRLAKILSRELRTKAGSLAEKLVNGGVSIGLKLSLDTRNLAAAGIERSIGVGCGLHPLSLAELAKLMPLPADINQLLQSSPSLTGDLTNLPALPTINGGTVTLPSNLPPLPSGMPALPSSLSAIPNLVLPSFTAPAPTKAPASASASAPAPPAKAAPASTSKAPPTSASKPAAKPAATN